MFAFEKALALVVSLVSFASAQRQLCVDGQSAPYCICGAERQANDMTLDLTISPNPPNSNAVIATFDMTFDRDFLLNSPADITVNVYEQGSVVFSYSLFQPPSLLTSYPPWPAGESTTSVRLNCGPKTCTPSNEFFWEFIWTDLHFNQLLCVRTQIWNQGVGVNNVPP